MSTHHHDDHHDHTPATEKPCGGHSHVTGSLNQRDPTELALCPVMEGTPVVKQEAEEAGLFRDVDGQRYWLCCAACGPLFDADPARYTAA